MHNIIEINAKEIIEMLHKLGITCDDLYFQGNKWSYHWGFLEGESKWALRLCVEKDDRYKTEDSLGIFSGTFGRTIIPPAEATRFLANQNLLEEGEYLIWCSW